MGKILLTDILYKDYLDEEVCFGSREEGLCYDPKADQCVDCRDKELCKLLFEMEPGTKVINAITADAAEVFCDDENNGGVDNEEEVVEEETNETEPILTREIVTDELVTRYNLDRKTLKTRDNLFDGDRQVFTVTDQSLRVIGDIPQGVWGLQKTQFEEKANGIQLDYEINDKPNTKAVWVIIDNWIEPVSVDLEEKPSTDLLDKIKDESVPNKGTIVPNKGTDLSQVSPHSDEKIAEQRSVVGGISVVVYSDSTVEIATTVQKERFDIDAIMNKMKSLLESYLN